MGQVTRKRGRTSNFTPEQQEILRRLEEAQQKIYDIQRQIRKIEKWRRAMLAYGVDKGIAKPPLADAIGATSNFVTKEINAFYED